MNRYLGTDSTTAVKLPCTAPTSNDILTVDPADPTKGVFQKASTNNISDSAITTQKVADGAIATAKIADGSVLTAKIAANAVTNAKVDPAAAIDGSKLKEGSGPLTKLSSAGILDNLTSVATRPIDSLTDGTYARPLAAALSSGKLNLGSGAGGLSGQMGGANLLDGSITNAKVDAAAGIAGTKLAAGTGVLTNLSTGGAFNDIRNVTTRDLDGVTDGSTYKKITGVSAGNKVQAASVADGAIVPNHLTPEATFANSLVPNPTLSSFTNGTGSPPDGWTETLRTWGTDIQAVTTPILSGANALKFNMTAGGGHTSELTSAVWPVIEGHAYLWGIETYYVNSLATRGFVSMWVDWLDTAKALISSSQFGAVGGILGSGSYHRSYDSAAAPASARYARMRLQGIDDVNAATVYVDNVLFFEQPDFGTAFPAGPFNGQRFFRTDQGINYYYDGTRWLSVQQFTLSMPAYSVLPNGVAATNSTVLVCPHDPPSGQVLMEKWTVDRNTAAANDATHFWTYDLKNDAGTVISTFDTKTDAAGTWVRGSNSPNSVRTLSTDKYWFVLCTKSGVTGNTNMACTITYRVVG